MTLIETVDVGIQTIPEQLRIIHLDQLQNLIISTDPDNIIIGLGEGNTPVAPYAIAEKSIKISIDHLYRPRFYDTLNRSKSIQSASSEDPNWYLCYGDLDHFDIPHMNKNLSLLAFFPDNEWQYLIDIQKKYPAAYILIITPIYSKRYLARHHLLDQPEMAIAIHDAFLENNATVVMEQIPPSEYQTRYPETTWSKIIFESEPDDLEGIAVIEVNPEKRIKFKQPTTY